MHLCVQCQLSVFDSTSNAKLNQSLRDSLFIETPVGKNSLQAETEVFMWSEQFRSTEMNQLSRRIYEMG